MIIIMITDIFWFPITIVLVIVSNSLIVNLYSHMYIQSIQSDMPIAKTFTCLGKKSTPLCAEINASKKLWKAVLCAYIAHYSIQSQNGF